MLVFNNWEFVMSTNGSFIENEKVKIKLFRCLKSKEKGVTLERKVRFDNEAKDLYIKVEGKRYFASEFK